MSDTQLILLYIPIITIASSVAYNSIMFSKESKYIKATYRRKERERIIALLEVEKLHSIRLFPSDVHTEDCLACEIIALIKGENE